MRFYSIHHRHRNPEDILSRSDGAIFVKQGFSWGAFALQPFWLVLHGLWLAAILYAVFVSVIFVLAELMAPAWAAIVFVTTAILFAFEANDIRRYFLSLKGHYSIGLVAGYSLDDCERKFFAQCVATVEKQSGTTQSRVVSTPPVTINLSSPAPFSSDDDAVIGLFPRSGA